MIRTVAFAAALAALSTPALAKDSIAVATAGKDRAVLKTELMDAARTVCRPQTFSLGEHEACARAVANEALARVDAARAQYAQAAAARAGAAD